MDYKNDERYWNIKLLNKWFAISSILFLFSILWMFVHDNDDEFKEYQREFRKLEAQISVDKLDVELQKVVSERGVYEDKYTVEQDKYNSNQSKIDSLNQVLNEIKGDFYKKNMDYLFYKAEVDVIKYKLEKDLSEAHHHHDEKHHESKNDGDSHHNHSKYEVEYSDAIIKLNGLKLIKEKLEKDIANVESELKSLRIDLKIAEDNLNKYLKNVKLLEKKISNLDRNKMTLANQLGDIVRDLPIVDFMDPYYKVNQIVAHDVKYDVNFASVPAVDRCTSCHLGIDNPDFENAPQPYKTHPRLDLYITSASPHSMDQFGCTSCHAGRARGTTFNSSSHTPGSPEQKKEWEEKYDWEKIHHWLQPMLPTKYTQASCFTCHESQPIVDGGDKLALGLNLISKSGCNNCHHVETYPKKNNAGPPLTHLERKLDKEWVAKWVEDPQSFRHNTWMPHFFKQDNNSSPEMIERNNSEIYAITEYLFKNGDRNKVNSSKYVGDSDNGKVLFEAVGCMGCHQVDEDKVNPEFDGVPYEMLTSKFGYDNYDMTGYELLKNQGPNLIGMGSKTDAEWIYNWIKNPSDYYPETRMPDLRLSHDEAADITAYLLTLKNHDFDNASSPEYNKEVIKDIAKNWLIKSYPEKDALNKLDNMSDNQLVDYVGKKSINYYGCYNCHDIDGFENAKPIGTELTTQGSKPVGKLDFGHLHDIEHANHAWFEQKLANPRIFDRGRVVQPEDKLRMPNFYFTPDEIEAITTAILSFNSNKYSDKMLVENLVDDKNVFKGYSLIQKYNCQGCHIIDGFGGQIADVIGSPEFSPPNLNTQGVKTQPDWLFGFFKDPITIRPNLQVRMPSFTMMSDADWNNIITAFQDMDSHNLSFEGHVDIDTTSSGYKGAYYIHKEGACNNCHFYGETKPLQGPSTWAPNLAMTKERLRHEWVIDWLRDPGAIMPGTKMPAPYLPDHDILQLDGADTTWGKDLIEIDGDKDIMLKGLTNYIFNIQDIDSLHDQLDITNIVKEYFKENGYDFIKPQDEDDEDDWDEEW